MTNAHFNVYVYDNISNWVVIHIEQNITATTQKKATPSLLRTNSMKKIPSSRNIHVN